MGGFITLVCRAESEFVLQSIREHGENEVKMAEQLMRRVVVSGDGD